MSDIEFKVGDKLEALGYHKEEHNVEYVIITGINLKTKVYYWVADFKGKYGKLSSGYYFHEAKAYKEK